MGEKIKIQQLPSRIEVKRAFESHQKSRNVFGDLYSNISLQEGLSRMALWVEEHGSRESQPFSHIEIAKIYLYSGDKLFAMTRFPEVHIPCRQPKHRKPMNGSTIKKEPY